MQTLIKPFFLSIFLALTLTQCKKSTVNQIDLLPPITTSGANTFGCLVNGTAVSPRDALPSFSNPFPRNAVEIINKANDIVDVEVGNGRDDKQLRFFLCFHFTNFSKSQPGTYIWKQSTFGSESFPYYNNHVYGSLYDSDRNNYYWYGSYESSGTVTITRNDTINHILSGIFSGNLKEKNGIKEIEISNGRFDFGSNINSTKFP